MADEPENHTLALLQAIRADIAKGFAKMEERFDKLEAHVTASDSENAKILETITHDLADLKTIFVDLQARVVRTEKRVKPLRPEA